MEPKVETKDGRPVEVGPIDADAVNAQFDRVMLDDGPDEQAPPRRQPKADDAAEKPRRGRRPKSEQARTVDKAAQAPPAPPTPEVTAKRASSAEESFRMAGTCLLVAGKVTRMPSFTADGFVVNANAAPLSVALADVAAVEPQIAKWLDKAPSAKVTAWMGLASVASGVALQAAANHRLIKPGAMGTISPAEIIRLNEEAAAARQQAIEDQAAETAEDHSGSDDEQAVPAAAQPG